MTADLLAWLDRVITEREEAARRLVGVGGCSDWGHCQPDCLHENRDTDVQQDVTARLHRYAADRKLLKLHGGNMHSCPATDDTGYLDEWTHFGHDDTCPVVQLLAEGYGWTTS
ncbi:hypothetical protein [Streptomyces alboviridis]|uniref:hypothetical protein n=1 Tax=Streptomyces alboviridis TaxID=67269 RepID=UPI000516C771|nr:hypothetical protein [Streptomyces alboviridis]